MPEVGNTPRLHGAQLVIGGQESLNQMAAIGETATNRLDVDLFAGSHPETLDRLAAASEGKDSLFLTDPEVKAKIRTVAGSHGAAVVDSGAFPGKNHAKSVVADADRAMVTTAALAPRTPERFEAGAVFKGDAARAMSELTRASATGDTAAIQAAAENARRYGIVVNDPAHGVWHLTDEVRGLVTGAQDRLIVATKRLEEPGIMELIKDAKKRGVDVTVARKVGNGMPLHANIVIADNAAYVGSGHLTKRVLTGGGSNGRISRELGIVLEEPKLVDDLTRSLADQNFIGTLTETGVPKASLASKLKVPAIAAGGLLAAGAAAALIIRANSGDSK